MELISVVIPVYNVEKYIARCIESVTAQSYTDLQIILVDDGSPDKSGEICDGYAANDTRIEVIHKKNGGLSDARNYGLDAARGKYIAFIDSDDYVHKDFIKTLYNMCVKNSCQIAQCEFERVDSDMFSPDLTDTVVTICSSIDMLSNLYSDLYVQTVIVCDKLYETRLFENIRFPVGKLHEDEATTYKLIYAAQSIAVTNARLYAYFNTQDSITRKKYDVRRLDMLPILKERADFFLSHSLMHLHALATEKYCLLLADNAYMLKKHVAGSKDMRKKLCREAKALARTLMRDKSKGAYMRIKLALLALFPMWYAGLRHRGE